MNRVSAESIDHRVRILWLRDSAPNRVECDFDLRVAPECVRTEVQSLTGVDCIPDGLAEAGDELHLPYIERRDWPQCAEILAATTFRRIGRVVMPAAYAESTAELARYQARLIVMAAFHTGQAPTAWRTLPSENSPAYFTALAPVSVALQMAVREALRTHWLRDLDRCADWDNTCAVLTYAGSAPFPGRYRTQFTYDVLEPEWIYRALHKARKPLATSIASLRAALVAAGRPEVAALYDQEEPKGIIESIRKKVSRVESIYAAEEVIVNLMFRFGLAIRKAATERAAIQAVVPFMHNLEVRLRRIFRDEDLAYAAPRLLRIATLAASQSMNNPHPIGFAIADIDCALPPGKHPMRPCESTFERISATLATRKAA
jgi:hypothetical protein